MRFFSGSTLRENELFDKILIERNRIYYLFI